MDFMFASPEKKDVDAEALKLATQSLQSLEQLRLKVKSSPVQYSDGVSVKIRSTLDELRDIKSQVEGSFDNYVAMSINELPLQELRQLTLMHVPTSLTSEVKDKFGALLSKVFEGRARKVLTAVMLTCPWYSASQRERGEQARHNIILVVYVGHDDQFFTPANPHNQIEGKVIDLGWLQAVELSHFGHFLAKGRTRFVESLLCGQQAVLYDSTEWTALTTRLQHTQVMGSRGFVEASRGQAVGGISKKRKTGGLKLKDTTTFFQLCESCRLLHHLEQVLAGRSVCSQVEEDDLSDIGRKALNILKSMYQEGGGTKHEFFPILVEWKEELDAKLKSFQFSKPAELEQVIGGWMASTRLQGRQLHPLTCIEDERSSLVKLMEMIGGPVKKMEPSQILLVARAGSYMYGLSTPDSDVDYMVVYAEPNMTVLSACRQLTESVENRGPQKQFEYGAYEARLFCEMVMKASVVILELIFTDSHEYMSPAWKALSERKSSFVTERGIQQYLGLIKNNFNIIDSQKHIGSGRDRKLFYQIFHKLDSLNYMARGDCPPVKCEGEVRDFIMRVRTLPLEGDLERETLHQLARAKFNTLVSNLSRRENRLAENTDYRLMLNWLKAVRGLDS
ncbi:uncharacterized protein [Haliotis cracherodii]|uniref:uncharacterized protein n=1 Tax=Haliotis cracherodii TaxID=6455 RepID=UPI0039EC07A4